MSPSPFLPISLMSHALVAVAVGVVIIVTDGGDLSSLQPSHPRPLYSCLLSSTARTCNPPSEQWLTELGVGAGCCSLVLGSLAYSCGGAHCLSLSVVIPLSTLQAVAHSGGIGGAGLSL